MKIGKLVSLLILFLSCFLGLVGCEEQAWNNPYPFEPAEANTLYMAFTERPKHLDPARSYSATEWPIIAQIYEPPLQYHYLKRPYVLQPLTAANLPEIHYFDANGNEIQEKQNNNNNNKNNNNDHNDNIAYSEYWITIQAGIYYSPHPAFAKDAAGNFLYHHLDETQAKHYKTLADFQYTGTRELLAEDYVYQIKRLAEPSLNSPIFGFMSNYIVGLSELRQAIVANGLSAVEQDLRNYVFQGAEVIDRYRYKIRIKGKYPQFRYWLAMPFFSPIPWEVAVFFANPVFLKNNLSLDWYPIGTGPYIMTENNPDRRMILIKNSEFRDEFYPSEGEENDIAAGLLEAKGSKLPWIDKVIYTPEREDIPYWNKFLQGYYDFSGISSDNFGTAINFSVTGFPEVTAKFKKQGIRLQTALNPGIFYWGFNMLDETVGGNSERARKLRQAIALVFDVDEFLSIFANGRGSLAYGPIPPEVFGFETQQSLSREVSDNQNNLQKAKDLLKEAGYAEGLQIYYDAIVTGNPDEIAAQAWLREQFAKLNITLIIRGSDYNRFQDKIQHGSTQMFFFGWNADYPDPENFLFLFYGPNGSAKHAGENTVNYANPKYDSLFDKMKLLPDGAERLAVISEMIKILQHDSPWIWGFYPQSYQLRQGWMSSTKPSGVINNTLKYVKLNPELRAEKRRVWNQPMIWPILGLLVLVVLSFLPGIFRYWRQEHRPRERV